MKETAVDIKELVGQVFTKVYTNKDRTELIFEGERTFKFYHEQDCCESVDIEDIVGDLESLTGTPIIKAEEVTKNDENADECGMWTYYEFRTNQDYVTIRWYGTSNGYYSISVSLVEIESGEL